MQALHQQAYKPSARVLSVNNISLELDCPWAQENNCSEHSIDFRYPRFTMSHHRVSILIGGRSTMARIAQCLCGQVKITCWADPHPVVMCSCENCQRRTGAPAHIGAWFNLEDVTIEGETTAFTRTSGNPLPGATFNFCPKCGTSVWWAGSPESGRIGIAGGCFADKDFPEPTLAVFESRRHQWLTPPKGIPCFETVPSAEEMAGLFEKKS